jgi:hypothetical protein
VSCFRTYCILCAAVIRSTGAFAGSTAKSNPLSSYRHVLKFLYNLFINNLMDDGCMCVCVVFAIRFGALLLRDEKPALYKMTDCFFLLRYSWFALRI